MQEQPATVPQRDKQAGEAAPIVSAIRERWAWAEASVWTDRMLTALENGVKGGVWFSLIDKVYTRSNLWTSWCQTARNEGAAGVDHVTIKMYEEQVERNVGELAEALRAGSYRPAAIRRAYIPKPGSAEKRPPGIPTVRDRIVQGALRHVLEPIFERTFAEQSYGFRPGRGCKDALRRLEELLKSGYRWVVDADLKSYFDTIPHAKLIERIRERVADGRVLALIEAFLKQKILEGLSDWTPAAGAPQGAVLSPLLSNIYLNPLDHLMAGRGFQMIRYADDLVILCRSREEAEAALLELQRWTAQAGLTLHPTMTRLVHADEDAFQFLGYEFEPKGRHWPRTKSMNKLRETIRQKTRRMDGRLLKVIIGDVNNTLRGWFGYFKHSYRTTFAYVDGWVRMRLRSLLRFRQGRKGRGRGRTDHQRWPNAFFAAEGLHSLVVAHRRACQSVAR
jgi:RNA-directed DNA polymerase